MPAMSRGWICFTDCDIVATFLTTVSKPSEHGTNPTTTDHSVKTTGQAVRFNDGGPSILRISPTTAPEPPTTAGANKSPPLVNSNGPGLLPEIPGDIQPSLSSISPAATQTPAEGYGKCQGLVFNIIVLSCHNRAVICFCRSRCDSAGPQVKLTWTNHQAECLSSAPLDLETRIRPTKSTSRFLSTVPLSIYFFLGYFTCE